MFNLCFTSYIATFKNMDYNIYIYIYIYIIHIFFVFSLILVRCITGFL